jgi:transposase
VFRAVKFVVDYGLAHRSLEGVTEIGVDEIAVFKGHKYLTLVYQLNAGARRHLWCGPERRVKTLLRFFREFGQERSAKLQFVCSDMWAPCLKVIAKKAPQALNILDRFHIMRKFNEAIDEIRRGEVKLFKVNQQENVLERGRWLLLKRPENLSEKQTAGWMNCSSSTWRRSRATFCARTSNASGTTSDQTSRESFSTTG